MVSTTMASVILLLGKLRAPETYRLVEVIEVNLLSVEETSTKDVLVVKTIDPFEKAINEVPVTELAES